jgi:RNA polymerase sigma-70 factor (ECF subfamily)
VPQDETDLAGQLRRCLAGANETDWNLFIRLSQPVVASGILRSVSGAARADRGLVEDLIQDVFLKLCADDFRALRSFRGADANALRAYLKAIAGALAMDHFRSQSSRKKGSGKGPASLDDLPSPPGENDPQFDLLERRLLLQHVDKCLDSQEPRNRTIFWLYHRDGFSPKAISALPGMNLGSGGVETAIYRLTQAVRDCLRRAGLLQSAAAIREGGRV